MNLTKQFWTILKNPFLACLPMETFFLLFALFLLSPKFLLFFQMCVRKSSFFYPRAAIVGQTGDVHERINEVCMEVGAFSCTLANLLAC